MKSKLTSRIVLIGGGHSHVQFIKNWGMHPLAGVEVILISKEDETPYSGMLPSRLAGWYQDHEMQFALPNLCAQNDITFMRDQAERLDPSAQKIFLRDRPPLTYDVVSLNVGVTPQLPPGAANHPRVLAVKPIAELLGKWEKLSPELLGRRVIVGAGAAGFELAMISAMQNHAGREIWLLQSGERILPEYSNRVRARALRLLRDAKVEVKLGYKVREVRQLDLLCSSGEQIVFSDAIFTTGAVAPAWLASCGLNVNAQGFVMVDANLRALEHEKVFAVGDCIDFGPRSLPKSGVFAVREGPTLIANIRSVILNEQKALRIYKPQRRTLSLLTSGERRALLAYGPLAIEGRWPWAWKDRIDRHFMRKFGAIETSPMVIDANTCGGCGGKLSALEVNATVEELRAHPEFAVLLPTTIEDVGQAGSILTTIDGFRSFTRDLYFFGQVSAWHALNDLFASGLVPSGVNVYVGLPPAVTKLRQNQLSQIMVGVLQVLNVNKAPLLNAHSAEASEPTLVLNPVATAQKILWTKGGLRVGDVLVLTKALGTGGLLQAQMMGALSSPHGKALRDSLLLNHAELPNLLKSFAISACTDVSGFGLVGHLSEMVRASKVDVRVEIAQVPVLPGYAEVEARGFRSLLAVDNQLAFPVRQPAPKNLVLWDPQTHGPLLFGIAKEQAELLVQTLRKSGFAEAATVGTVVDLGVGEIHLILRHLPE